MIGGLESIWVFRLSQISELGKDAGLMTYRLIHKLANYRRYPENNFRAVKN